MKNRIINIMVIITLVFLNVMILNVNAETIIYDNLTTSNYNIIKIVDDLNYKILTDYNYDVFVNGSFLGEYKKDENIFIPDNSQIVIYIPSPIRTDVNGFWIVVKSNGIIIISFLITFVIVIMILLKVYRVLKH